MHGEKLCEVVVQKRICSFREEKVAKGIMMADLEQEEMMRLYVEALRDIEVEFQT